MDVLRKLWSWMRGRVADGKGAARLWAALLAILVLAGGIWMIHADRRQDMVPAMDARLTGRKLSAAVELLEGRGIACIAEQGQVLVPPHAVMRARKLLAEEGLADDLDRQFEQFIVGDDLWATQAQNEKRWQAAKMATLSRLIGNFPSVRRAVVLFEPGRGGKLGRSGIKPTAAVHVSLADSSEMTARLVAAIADTVAGSIANLNREDVCVVDSRGPSYRAGDETLAAEEALALRRRLEGHYERKIAGALAHIRNLTVAVNLGQGRQPRRTGVVLAVPRSYFHAIAADHQGHWAEGIAGVVASESDRIRQMVMSLIGGLGAADVTVDCYYDVPAVGLAGEDDDRSDSAAGGIWPAAASWAPLPLAAGGAFCWWVLIRRRRRRRLVARRVALPDTRAVSAEPDSAALPADGQGERVAAPPLAFLADVPDEDLLWLLGAEQAQTIALVVSKVGYDRAATVLAALEPHRQEQVIKRLVGLGKVDPETITAVAQSLAAVAGRYCAGGASLSWGPGFFRRVVGWLMRSEGTKISEKLGSLQGLRVI